MIGTNTALKDNPYLTVRDWKGANPVRIVIDRALRIPESFHVFNDSTPTIIFNEKKSEAKGHLEWAAVDFGDQIIQDMLNHLAKKKIQSVIIEGGAKLLQSFIDKNLWDEARIFTGNKWLGEGIKSPALKNFEVVSDEEIEEDQLTIMKNV
jgi:diaminohydroxyphosphoribosylaminopyrimidine deaminase/5-amino-6-(5-phosphoribosylamino)uracil reductase